MSLIPTIATRCPGRASARYLLVKLLLQGLQLRHERFYLRLKLIDGKSRTDHRCKGGDGKR
jgi:hypothetical protein